MGISITDTTLRDGNQSLIGGRMLTSDMLPIAEKLDKVGFFSIEVWGGTTFDACIRLLNEDPWDRLKALKEKMRNTRLQMPLQGQLLVGQSQYADDVVHEFIHLAVRNGIDIISMYDALNDVRNMELAIKVAKEYGAHVQGAICYTTSPAFTVDSFVEMARTLQKLDCDSICLKDSAGLLSPAAVTQLVGAIKKKVKLPLVVHTHCSSGMAPLTCYAAAAAGADVIDTAFSAFAFGSAPSPVESIVTAFKDTPYDTGLDLALLDEIGEDFAGLSSKYKGLFNSDTSRPSVSLLRTQVPKAMLMNMIRQIDGLAPTDAIPKEKMAKVLEEVPKVWKDFGYPPIGPATGQLIATQAVMNALSGKRYEEVTPVVKSYFLGQYGQPPSAVDAQIKKQVIGTDKPVAVRPADLLVPELGKLRAEGKGMGILKKDEDLVTYALYPDVGAKFLGGQIKAEAIPASGAAGGAGPAGTGLVLNVPIEFSVDVEDETFKVKVTPTAIAGAAPAAGGEAPKPAAKKEPPPGAILAKAQAVVVAVKVKAGDEVKEGDILVTVEAMKMRTHMKAPKAGKVTEVGVKEGDSVKAGAFLVAVV